MLDTASVQVAKDEHLSETLFTRRIETAAGRTGGRVFQGAEECVPERKIGEVIGVMPKLMMNAVRLRALHDKAEPARGADIPMIKILRQRREQRADRSCPRAAPAGSKSSPAFISIRSRSSSIPS